ncbi:MAG: FAD:protein FMN transferase [Myxococcota bacterium]
MRRHLPVLVLLLVAPLALAQGTDAGLPPPPPTPPPPPPPPAVLRHTRTVDGLQLQALMMVAPDAADPARAAADDAFAEYARVLQLMEGMDGAVQRVERNAGVAPVPVAPEAFLIISEAARIAALTDGAYDPTVAAYASAWPFDDMNNNQSPAPEELQRRSALVDYKQLVVDPVAQTALLKKPGMKLDLKEPTRGLALDRAMTILRDKGFGDSVIYAGGDLVVSGHKGGKRWMVGIQDPRGSGHFAALPVAGGAVFTVGDYERSFMERGRRQHSVLDPRTGQPARAARSVTVLAPTGIEAAALSTAVFVMGPERGMKLAERLPNVNALMVDDRNRVLATRGVANNVKYRPPTDGP